MSDRISLVRWRDAKTEPPEDYKVVKTDVGYAYVGHDGDWMLVSVFESMYAGHKLAWPSVWCDPSPPGDDALTLKDLQRAHDALLYASGNLDHGILTVVYPEECEASAARLRRALDQIGST